MSLQQSIRLALLGVIAICGCSTGTPNLSSMSFNPFSGLSANWTAKEKPASPYALSTKSQPKKPPTLDWFRRGGTKDTSVAQPSLNPQAMFAQQSIARQQTSLPAFPQIQQAAQQGFAPAYPPPRQTMPQQGPFVNSGNVASTVAPSYGAGTYAAAQGYMPPQNTAQQYPQMPPTAPVQYAVPAQNAAVAAHGAPAQTSQYPSVPGYAAAPAQYAPAQYAPAQYAPAQYSPAQYSTASQQNAPQYTQPNGHQGSSLR
jgi:hypothetical protein